MLSWKLTSMVLLMTFSMVIVSSIIISMSTLYYSFDLKFLFSCPLDLRSIFMDKALETVFLLVVDAGAGYTALHYSPWPC